MKTLRSLTFLLVLSVIGLSKAWSAVGLFAWQPSSEHPTYILPRRDGESEREAIEKFRAFWFAQTPWCQLGGDVFGSGEGETTNLNAARDRLLFVANHLGDHGGGSTRATRFMSQFPESENRVLPLAAAARLKPRERREFWSLLNQKFAGLVIMGGDDVAPELYLEQVNGARGFLKERDQLEIEFIRFWTAQKRGFLYGVCRGMQITSVALGSKLIQDLPTQWPGAISEHADGFHPVELKPTTNGILAKALQGFAGLPFYNYHHQAVTDISADQLELAALSPDGVIEALEFKNGRGLLTQFHPELRNLPQGREVLRTVWEAARREVGTFSCSRVFRGN